MALTHYACTHCGGWALWFEHERPPFCAICMDPRNALPEDGFTFVTKDEALRDRTTTLARIDERLLVARENPALGLGSAGWVIEAENARVTVEAAGLYTDDVLAAIGRVDVCAASHPHGYGALWQLQEKNGAPAAVHRADIPHTKAFKVQRPLDDGGELAPGIRYAKLGGHYDGQTAFYDEEAARIFLGDAVKVEYADSGAPVALSAHKGFHYQIPLTDREIEGYTEVLARFPFRHTATTFDHAQDLTQEIVLAFLSKLQSSPPTTEPIPIESL